MGTPTLIKTRQIESGTFGGGIGALIIKDEGVFLATGTVLDFVGDGVTPTASGTNIRVYIPAGGGGGGLGVVVQDEGAFLATGTVLNFVGDGVTASASGTNIRVYVPVSTGTLLGGWIPLTGTYLSADSPSYVMSFTGDMTGILSAGMRFKVTASGTVNQFIITAIGSYSGGATPVTLYGGTDYTLPSGTMASPYYSREKAPFGFPVSPIKWTVTATDSTNAQQASAVTGTWYNLGSINISIPIGVWHVSYQVALRNSIAAGNQVDSKVTLSTGNNTQSDAAFTAMMNIANDHATALFTQITSITRFKYLLLASKTTYYLNAVTSIATSTLNFRGDILTTTILCVCAYL